MPRQIILIMKNFTARFIPRYLPLFALIAKYLLRPLFANLLECFFNHRVVYVKAWRRDLFAYIAFSLARRSVVLSKDDFRVGGGPKFPRSPSQRIGKCTRTSSFLSKRNFLKLAIELGVSSCVAAGTNSGIE